MIRAVIDSDTLLRAVIDTNVLIRAVIRPEGSVGPIAVRFRRGDYLLIYSKPLLDELTEKLNLPRIRDKYNVGERGVQQFLDEVVTGGHSVEPTEKIEVCRDPDDNMLLEAAVAGKADYIVTGDEDLLVLQEYRTIRIMTPAVFLRALDSK